MTQQEQDITHELKDIETKWKDAQNRTKKKFLTMQPHYSNPSDRAGVLERIKDDRKALEENYEE